MLGKWPFPAKLPETRALKVSALDQVIEVRALEGQSAVAERVEAPSSGDSRSEALTISRLLTYLRVVGSYLRL